MPFSSTSAQSSPGTVSKDAYGRGVRMRIVLQNRDTLLYFQSPSRWTPDVDKATDFEHVLRAHAYASQAEQANLDVVMAFGDRQYDIRLPLRA
jgi:hypothetical protein